MFPYEGNHKDFYPFSYKCCHFIFFFMAEENSIVYLYYIFFSHASVDKQRGQLHALTVTIINMGESVSL